MQDRAIILSLILAIVRHNLQIIYPISVGTSSSSATSWSPMVILANENFPVGKGVDLWNKTENWVTALVVLLLVRKNIHVCRYRRVSFLWFHQLQCLEQTQNLLTISLWFQTQWRKVDDDVFFMALLVRQSCKKYANFISALAY